MPIAKLDHVNIRTSQLTLLINWYTQVLGLVQGYRPESQTVGAWLYAGEQAVVHLVEVDGEAGVGSECDLKLEHFAFSANDLSGFLAKLLEYDIPYFRSDMSDVNLVLINLSDPDGNHIHVDFPTEE